MKEYIEREAVCYQLEKQESIDGQPRAIRRARRIVADFPAADVASVRHGRWIADKEDVEWGNSLIRYRCSECKERPHFDKDKYKFILSPYCPDCGARMDGGGEW